MEVNLFFWVIHEGQCSLIIKDLLIFSGFLHYNVRWLITLLYVHMWVGVIHGIHDHWSLTNKDYPQHLKRWYMYCLSISKMYAISPLWVGNICIMVSFWIGDITNSSYLFEDGFHLLHHHSRVSNISICLSMGLEFYSSIKGFKDSEEWNIFLHFPDSLINVVFLLFALHFNPS